MSCKKTNRSAAYKMISTLRLMKRKVASDLRNLSSLPTWKYSLVNDSSITNFFVYVHK